MDDIPGAIEWLDADTTGTLVKSIATGLLANTKFCTEYIQMLAGFN